MGTGAGLPKHDPETGFFRGVAGEFWGRTHQTIANSQTVVTFNFERNIKLSALVYTNLHNH